MPSSCRSARSRRGFTLIEMVVVVAILLLLAGVSIPLVWAQVERERADATVREVDYLVQACLCFFHDTLRLPEHLLELGVRPKGAPGWAGPYIGWGTTNRTGEADYLLDAWDRPYEVIPENSSRISIYCAGADTEVLEDDIVRWVDVTPQRREFTLDRLAIVNAAIDRYLRSYPDQRFLLDVPQVLATLRKAGYLNNDGELERDGWGEAWLPDPLGMPPILRLTSRQFLRPGESRDGPGSGGSSVGTGLSGP